VQVGYFDVAARLSAGDGPIIIIIIIIHEFHRDASLETKLQGRGYNNWKSTQDSPLMSHGTQSVIE